MGLPHLSGTDLIRVLLANELYEFVSRVAQTCIRLAVPFAIENPFNSLFWFVPSIVEIRKLSIDVPYSACMHGGKRAKKQLLVTNCAELSTLALQCDKSHRHCHGFFQAGNLQPLKKRRSPCSFCRRVAEILYRCRHSAILASKIITANQSIHGTATQTNLPCAVLSEFSHVLPISLPLFCESMGCARPPGTFQYHMHACF
jgi:hypothetical protein